MTGDVHEAEDLAQDAFIHVFRKLDTFRGDSTFSTWLYRVAFNTVLMRLRKRQLRPISLDEPVRLDSSVVARDVGCSDLELLGAIDRIAWIARSRNCLGMPYDLSFTRSGRLRTPGNRDPAALLGGQLEVATA